MLANDGEVEERGYIEGGEILLRVGDTLYVQNSGTADTFAGRVSTMKTAFRQTTGGDRPAAPARPQAAAAAPAGPAA